MKHIILHFLVISLLASMFICCVERRGMLDDVEVDSNNIQKQYQKSWEKIYLKMILERIEETKITDLRYKELPPNSKEIRIWASFDKPSFRGLILSQNNEEWTALFIPPSGSSEKLEDSRLLPPPKMGWINLWAKLDSLEIMTLPDPMDVSEIDGSTVVVEIKNGDSYRNYKYSNLGKMNSNNHKKILEICETLSNEFNIELLKYFVPVK